MSPAKLTRVIQKHCFSRPGSGLDRRPGTAAHRAGTTRHPTLHQPYGGHTGTIATIKTGARFLRGNEMGIHQLGTARFTDVSQRHLSGVQARL